MAHGHGHARNCRCGFCRKSGMIAGRRRRRGRRGRRRRGLYG